MSMLRVSTDYYTLRLRQRVSPNSNAYALRGHAFCSLASEKKNLRICSHDMDDERNRTEYMDMGLKTIARIVEAVRYMYILCI